MSELRLKGENEERPINKQDILQEREDWLEEQEPYVIKATNIPDETAQELVLEGLEQLKQRAPEIIRDKMDQFQTSVLGVSSSSAREMETVAGSFQHTYREYFKGNVNDEKLLELTTQPFWQSMRLSRRRLQDKGLEMEVELHPQPGKKSDWITIMKYKKSPIDYKMVTRGDGQNEYGVYGNDVCVKRKFFKNGKVISKKETVEHHTLTCLKSRVEGEQAACPNCGYVGTIASFTDGCDACGSRFTVHDFEPKVSGFSLEENAYIKVSNLIKNAQTYMSIVYVIIMISMFSLVLISEKYPNAPWLEDTIQSVGTGIMGVFRSVPIFVVVILGLTMVQAVLQYLIAKPIKGENVAKQVMRDISVNDFYQNLEYKIRNIHLTNQVSEVESFAKCNLGTVLSSYQDVVDCDMTRLAFVSGRRDADCYHLTCKARLRNAQYKGKRIKYGYEDVLVNVHGKRDVVDKEVTAMRMYRCENCGSTLNLLEGAKCASCGTEYDLEKYDWVIDSYQAEKKYLDLLPFIFRVLMPVVFVIAVLMSVLTVDTFLAKY